MPISQPQMPQILKQVFTERKCFQYLIMMICFLHMSEVESSWNGLRTLGAIYSTRKLHHLAAKITLFSSKNIYLLKDTFHKSNKTICHTKEKKYTILLFISYVKKKRMYIRTGVFLKTEQIMLL